MIPLMWHYIKAFFWDQNAGKRFLVGLGALVANVITSLAIFGLPTIAAWSRKELAQHLIFVFFSTLATMLPGPAIAKPTDNKVIDLVPPRGYTTFPFVMAGVCGVAQALVLGMALRSLGMNGHGWAIVCLAGGGAMGWAVWRAFK